MKKRFLALMMAVMLTVHPVCVYALDPVTTAITIINAEYGAAGLGAVAASAPIAGVAVAVVLAVCAGLTVDSKITQASANAGMTKSEYIKQKIQQFCSATGKNITDFYSTIANHLKITSAGKFILDYAGSQALKQFFDWADTNGQMIQTGTENIPSMVNNTYYGSNWNVANNSSQYAYAMSQACAFVILKRYNGFIRVVYTNVSGVTGTIVTTGNGAGTTNISLETVKNGYYYSYVSTNTPFIEYTSGTAVVDYPNYSTANAIDAYFNSLTGFDVTPGTADRDAMTIDEPWEQVKAKVDPAEGESVVVDPKVLDSLINTVPATDKTLTMDLGDYVDAIRKAFDKTLADTVPATDTKTGETVALPLDTTDIAETDLTKTAVEDIPADYPDATDVVNPSLPVAPVDALPNLQFSLSEYFPFCLPYDAYNLLNKLAADPVTPSWNYTFVEPYTGAQGNLSGDLHDWDGVASVVRNMELIVFIVGLAVVTRNMFIRS